MGIARCGESAFFRCDRLSLAAVRLVQFSFFCFVRYCSG